MVVSSEQILAGFGRSSLNRSLIADGHNPVTVALDPQAAHMDRLAGVRLVEAGHHHGVSEIKHLRRYQRGGRRTMACLLLQIESCDAVGLAQWMVVARAEHNEFFRDMRRPSGSVMVRNARLQGLPGSDYGLLRFGFRFEWHRLAGILAVIHAGPGRSRGPLAQSDLVIHDQSPARRMLYPDAQNVDSVTAGHHRADLTVRARLKLRPGFVAKCGGGQGLEDVSPGLRLS